MGLSVALAAVGVNQGRPQFSQPPFQAAAIGQGLPQVYMRNHLTWLAGSAFPFRKTHVKMVRDNQIGRPVRRLITDGRTPRRFKAVWGHTPTRPFLFGRPA